MAAFVKVTRLQETPSEIIDQPPLVRAYWERHIATRPDFDPCKEWIFTFCLNARLRLCGVNMVSCGSLNESVAHPREIFRPAVAMAAYAIILAHNHPSGDPQPSHADQRLTQRLKEAGQILEISLTDHVIVGKDRHFSFREGGLL
jgi:DNA repair protein RadC